MKTHFKARLSMGLWGLSGPDVMMIAMLIVSLGLPWAFVSGIDASVIPGYYVPGICSTVYGYDGWASMECTMGFVGAPIYLPGFQGGAVFGAEHPGRFGVVGCIVLLILAARRKSQKLRDLATVLLLAMTTLTAGLGFNSAGSGMAWLVVILLGFARYFPRQKVLKI